MRAHTGQSPIPPGPRSRFPIKTLIRLRRDVLGYLTRMCRQYGDALSFETGFDRYYLFNSPQAIRDVLVTYEDAFIKGPALQRAKETLGEGLLTSEGEFHKRQRRLAQPAFHPNRVNTYAATMATIAAESVSQWKDGQLVDLHEQMMKVTLRIVAKTLFDTQIESDLDAIGQSMDIMVGRFMRAVSPWGQLLNRLPLPSNARFRRGRRQLYSLIDRFIDEHRHSGDRGDLLSVLIRARDTEGDQGQMSEELLRAESYTLFAAGHETTANALTFALILLAQHPEIEQRLVAELQTVLAGRPPTAEDVDRLEYTRMVIAEAMRIYPPVWSLGRQPLQDIDIAGWRVKKGSIVLLSQWVTHRDERYFPDPLKFDPMRWTDEARAARPRWTYFPFGGGSRQCIGESFAWSEAILVLAAVVQRWHIHPVNALTELKLYPTITLRPSSPILVRLRHRNGAPET